MSRVLCWQRLPHVGGSQLFVPSSHMLQQMAAQLTLCAPIAWLLDFLIACLLLALLDVQGHGSCQGQTCGPPTGVHAHRQPRRARLPGSDAGRRQLCVWQPVGGMGSWEQRMPLLLPV